MSANTTNFTESLSKIVAVFKTEISGLRTGRASSSLVENIKVEAYPGTYLTIKELATINTPEPRLVIIDPWDKSTIAKIEKALLQTPGLGGSPSVSEDIIRLPLPPMSEERRRETVKLVHSMTEESKQKVRDSRQDEMKRIESKKKEGVITEDEMFSEKKMVEERVKKTNEELSNLASTKEEEIMRI